MKKVGIVSCYFQKNYGSQLQTYALKKFLDINNIKNEIISVENLKDFKIGKKKYYFQQIFNFSFINAKFGMAKLIIDKKLNKALGKNIKIRNNKYDEFIRENYNLSISYSSYNELNELANRRYCDVIVGSDQLWLPGNVVANYYTLNWVPESINKISYATSFGVSEIPNKYKKLYKLFLNRINHLSVREESGVKLIKALIEKDSKLVSDPTLLLNVDQWNEIVPKERIVNDKYILCYFLGKSIKHRKFAERLKKETGYKIVSLNHADEYVKYSDTFCDIALYDIGPKEWINLIQNAEYICTDSFHGTIFSLMNNKEFFTFRRYKSGTKISTNSRIESILKMFNLKNRLLEGNEEIKDIINLKIDYKLVNIALNKFREESRKWLLESVTYKCDETKHVEFDETNKEDCCGCSACANICPKGAIKMVQDKEGFVYPIVNKEKCINCGLCKKICRINNPISESRIEQHSYIIQNKDEKVLKESTSGGAFTAIANYVLEKGGVVFGASFDEKFNVYHTYVESKEELYKFRNSKYVQSNIDDSYKMVKSFLEKDKMVCFSGTPCQIEGLKSYLQKDYKNLILVDIECRAVPSPKMFDIYKKIKEEECGKAVDIKFRDKKEYGYEYSQMSYTSNNKYCHSGVETNPYLRAFFSGLAVRPSCYSCRFKKRYRQSDITMWDFFDVYKLNKKFDNNKGVTRILTHSDKGKRIIEQLDNVIIEEYNPEDIIRGCKEFVKPVNYNINRNNFFKDMNNLSEREFIKKWFKDTIKVKVSRIIRHGAEKIGVYSKIKRIAKKILKK